MSLDSKAGLNSAQYQGGHADQMSRSLKYGLNKPAAPTAKRRAALSIFANDDDEDVADGFVAGDGRGSVQAQLARQAQQRSSSSKIDPRHAQALAQVKAQCSDG